LFVKSLREVGARCPPSNDAVAGVKDLSELVDDVEDVHLETDFRVVHEEAGDLGEFEKREGGERLGPPEELNNTKGAFVGSHRDC
jgi:hypothetical protein